MLAEDGIRIKIRDGTVTNRTVYVVMGINMNGDRDILGLGVGPSEGDPIVGPVVMRLVVG